MASIIMVLAVLLLYDYFFLILHVYSRKEKSFSLFFRHSVTLAEYQAIKW